VHKPDAIVESALRLVQTVRRPHSKRTIRAFADGIRGRRTEFADDGQCVRDQAKAAAWGDRDQCQNNILATPAIAPGCRTPESENES
jgi:hypothetical protein